VYVVRAGSGAEAVAEIAGELDEVTETWGLGGCGIAEGELGFEQDAGEGGVELAVQERGGGGVGGGEVLGAASEGAAGLANDARGAGESEVELEDQGAAGVLVEEIGGGGVGGGEAFVDEDEDEVVAAQGGERGAAAGSGFDLDAEIGSQRFYDGLGGGFRGDQEKGGGHRAPREEQGIEGRV